MLAMLGRTPCKAVLFGMVAGVVVVVAMQAGAAEAGGGCHSTATTTGKGVAVELRGSCFEPAVLTVEAGELVRWTNRDAVPHAVTGVGGTWGSYNQFGNGAAVTASFEEPGVYPYFCVLHPSMVGAVVVTAADDIEAPIRVADIVPRDPPAVSFEQPSAESPSSNGISAALAWSGLVVGAAAGFGAGAVWRRWRPRNA